MSVEKVLNPHFEITAKVNYHESESKPESHFYFFSYQITIINKSSMPAQLMSRHWIITDGNGKVEEVRGAGVVGVQPKIQPGQSYTYESACPLSTLSGSMRGFYQFVGKQGQSFEIEIPEFFLIAPSALH